jgi:hypothetical protein
MSRSYECYGIKGLLPLWQQAVSGTYLNHTNLVHTLLPYFLQISIIFTVLPGAFLVPKILSPIKNSNQILYTFLITYGHTVSPLPLLRIIIIIIIIILCD